ncbi:alpha/beta hydrolase fold protein [Mollisia scopiformis]|uniref:Alpha/beta hydrolase fold protein n=1 Tax=Mollisia scopiformis TaxID=149040 RepID=A0A194XBV6_MOLSC|nr:alpha/beta hydrolase fold protein [Mollisia scopiformis]KUJ17645.1 alpha/beta hydrolase fold protein [Mollisia scopiformis]
MQSHQFSTIPADGVDVFYRYAGPVDAPVILLLHGFPSSSHQFQNFIPYLAYHNYRVLAPDYPGFGFTVVPAERKYIYTFDNLSLTIAAFLDALHIQQFALFIFDYGAPIGLRIALDRPDAITAIISQNGNMYEEGLGETWGPMKKYWATDSAEDRAIIRARILSPERTIWQYTAGSPTGEKGVPPESYTLDLALMEREGNREIQLDLFRDYRTNVEMYPRFQAYLRERRPRALAVWGREDRSFVPAGAEAFRRDLENVEVGFVDAGHWALEERGEEVGGQVVEFLGRVLGSSKSGL